MLQHVKQLCQQHCHQNLLELKDLISKLDNNLYKKELAIFSGASFGQHTRHILEFYSCLLTAVDTVNYDLRKRDLQLEIDKNSAINNIDYLCTQLSLPPSSSFSPDAASEKMFLAIGFCNEQPIETTFSRELVYCLEHSIHHQALIKMGLLSLDLGHLVAENFGVAPSTLQHKQSLNFA